MIKFIVIACLFSLNAFACLNTIPESEAVKAIRLEPGAGSKTCADLPEETCHCFDGIDWDVAEIREEIVAPDGGEPYTRKVLVNNLEKIQEKRAAKELEENHREIKEGKKKSALQRLKSFDRNKSYTAAQLKEFIADLLDVRGASE